LLGFSVGHKIRVARHVALFACGGRPRAEFWRGAINAANRALAVSKVVLFGIQADGLNRPWSFPGHDGRRGQLIPERFRGNRRLCSGRASVPVYHPEGSEFLRSEIRKWRGVGRNAGPDMTGLNKTNGSAAAMVLQSWRVIICLGKKPAARQPGVVSTFRLQFKAIGRPLNGSRLCQAHATSNSRLPYRAIYSGTRAAGEPDAYCCEPREWPGLGVTLEKSMDKLSSVPRGELGRGGIYVD